MSYSAEVLADAPLVYLRLGEASGTVAADSSGNGRHGTYVATPTLGVAGLLAGDADTAVTFDGATEYVSVPNHASFAVDTATFEKMIQTTDSTASLVSHTGSANADKGCQLAIAGGKVTFSVFDAGGTGYSAVSAASVNDGAVHHAAGSFDGTWIRVYVDGVLDGATAHTQATLPHSSQPILVGARPNGPTSFFAGTGDEAAVYGTALPPGRIAAHYAAAVATATALDGDSARARTATADLQVQVPLDGDAVRERDATATVTVSLPLTVPHGPGWEFSHRTRTAHAVLTIRPHLVPEAEDLPIPTMHVTYTGVELDDEDNPVMLGAEETHGDCGFLKVVIAGRDLTKFRGERTHVGSWEDGDPGGSLGAKLAFPKVTVLDRPGSGALAWLYDYAPVEMFLVDEDGQILHTLFQGDTGVVSGRWDEKTGLDFTVHCPGVWEALDERITKPRVSSKIVDTGWLIARMVNREIEYGFPARRMTPDLTGVPTTERGSFGEPLASGTLTNLLAQVHVPGEEYTMRLGEHRRFHVVRRDLTTVHATLWAPQAGVTVDFLRDPAAAVTNMYGMGQDGAHAWRNMMYPNAPVSPPPYPLPDGVFFDPGDGETGFAPFSRMLRTRGWSLASGDTYLAGDEDEVRDFQDRVGIQVDGVVGGQTWNQGFQTGANAHALDDAWAAPLAQIRATDPYTYDGRGAVTGRYPGYDETIARRERLTQYGMLSKALARKSAKHTVARDHDPDWAGSVTLRNIDPPERPALTLTEGMNVLVREWMGEDVLLHVAHATKNPGTRGDRLVTLTGDQHGRPLQELYQVIQRRREIADIAGRRKVGRRGADRVPETVPFDQESGAGLLDEMAQTGGLWNVYPMPLGETTDIVRVRLVANGPTKISAALFEQFITAEMLIALPGLANPSVGANDPWQVNQARLRGMGLAWASGGPSAMQGYWPNDPGGALTGVLDDSGPGITFVSQRGVWGWLAVWTSTDCRISGDPAEGYRALYPAAVQ